MRNCEWPPRDTELGRNSAACPRDATSRSAESWVRDSSTDALRITATNLRHILDDIDRELERRDLVGSGEPRSEIRALLSELAPARFSRQAASSREIEKLAAAVS